MIWFWPTEKVLRSQLIGPSGEQLDIQEWDHYGQFSVPPSTALSWSSSGLEVQVPSDASVWIGEKEVCQVSDDDGVEMRLFWKKTPKNLKLRFGNHCELKIFEEKKRNWLPQKLSRSSLVWSLVILAHVGALAVAYYGAQDSLKLAFEKQQERIKQISLQNLKDISFQISARVVGDTDPSKAGQKAKSPPSANQKMQNLMNSWGVGKPIQHANVVLPKEKNRGYFGQKFDIKEAAGWRQLEIGEDVEDFGIEKDVGISEAEIAKAFSGISPRIKECYDDVLIRDSSFEGKPSIWVGIDTNGRVESVNVDQMKAKRPESLPSFEGCLRRAYAKVQLPKPNTAFQVHYSFILQQSRFSQES